MKYKIIEIPINKALKAVPRKKGVSNSHCSKCYLFMSTLCGVLPCNKKDRKDDKNVIFELTDIGGALDLSAAIIRSNKMLINSDANLIESLNRYIATLENKISYQTDLIKELRERLEVLLAAYSHK
ncbi:MAG: hypothetical protein LBI04_08600 [Treponema sp.]|nr:hypothetical protein [Treponema sp.]